MATNLPSYPTPFIGRADEITELGQLLDNPDCRLLTLVGPGGMGKTRLALEVAHFKLDNFPDGVYFVPLQPLQAADQVLAAVIDALPLQVTGDPQGQLLDYLHEKQILLLMDNFEQVLDAAALVSDFLAAPQVKVLATSREVLNLQGEWVRHVTGLTYPDDGHIQNDPDYSAVELFADCARRLHGDFSPERERAHVIIICQLVEGMPLGIELAAGWTTTLTCTVIADELQRSLHLLTSTTRDLPDRHRSMQAVFDHSWRLLTDEEQAVMRRLAVFRGGCTREAAEAITGATLPMLAALVAKSMLGHNPDSGRYNVHELLRQYAEAQLETAGEHEPIVDAHSAWYLDFLAQRERASLRPGMIAIMDAIEADFDNIRVAWQRAVTMHNSAAIGRAVECLTWFCNRRSRYIEHEDLLAGAQAQFAPAPGEPPPLVLAQLITRRAALIMEYHPSDEHIALARSLLEQSLDIVKRHENQFEIAYTYYRYGDFLVRTGNADAITPLEYSLGIFQQLEQPFFIGECLFFISYHHHDFDRLDQFFHYAQQCADLKLACGDNHGAGWIFFLISRARYDRGEDAKAEQAIRQVERLMAELGNPRGLFEVLGFRSQMAFYSGDFDEAHRLAREANKYAVAVKRLKDISWVDGLVTLKTCIVDEDYEHAWQLWEHTYSLHTHDVRLLLPLVALCGLERYEHARQQLVRVLGDYERQPSLRADNRWLTIGAIILAHQGNTTRAVELFGLVFAQPAAYVGWVSRWGLVTRLLGHLQDDLGTDAYDAAWEQGAKLDIHTTTLDLRKAIGGDHERLHEQANQALDEPLTPREREVLSLVAQGRSNRQIAEELVIAVNTVKRYVYDICQKLDAQNRTEAASRARVLKLLP